MNRKGIIRKMLQLSAWVLVGCGMITLLAAANSRQQEHLCEEVVVNIKGSGEKFYVEKQDILNQLQKANNGSLIQEPITSFDLTRLESALMTNPWIHEAEMYFDSRDVLHVVVTEREPIARVFTTVGSSYYMDSAGKRMPLMDKVSIRLPVVTNMIAAKRWNSKDSVLVKGLSTLLQFINADPFWTSQITQIDVRPNGSFEMIPLVGNHVIRIGEVENLEEKFHNLFLFYRQVLNKTGFDVYKMIDVQYKGQVIGIKNNPAQAVDSIQLQKNITALIDNMKAQAANDSLFTEKVNEFIQQKDTASVRFDAIVIDPSPEEKPVSNVAKPEVKEKPKEKEKPAVKKMPTVTTTQSSPKKPTQSKPSEKKPKAVMQKRA